MAPAPCALFSGRNFCSGNNAQGARAVHRPERPFYRERGCGQLARYCAAISSNAPGWALFHWPKGCPLAAAAVPTAIRKEGISFSRITPSCVPNRASSCPSFPLIWRKKAGWGTLSTSLTVPWKPMAPVWCVPQEEVQPEIWIGKGGIGQPCFPPHGLYAGGQKSLGIPGAYLADGTSDTADGGFKKRVGAIGGCIQHFLRFGAGQVDDINGLVGRKPQFHFFHVTDCIADAGEPGRIGLSSDGMIQNAVQAFLFLGDHAEAFCMALVAAFFDQNGGDGKVPDSLRKQKLLPASGDRPEYNYPLRRALPACSGCAPWLGIIVPYARNVSHMALI